MKSAGLLIFLAGIVIAVVSTVPYLFVMVLNDDPMMGRPTPQIILFLGGGVVGFICLLVGLVVDSRLRGISLPRIERDEHTPA